MSEIQHPSNEQQPSDPVEIVRPKPEDAEAIFNVQKITWLATYPKPELDITEDLIREQFEDSAGNPLPEKIEDWRHRIENQDGSQEVFVARKDGEIVGFAVAAIIEDQYRLKALYVLPNMQGQGIGSALLRNATEWLGTKTDIYLHVAEYNLDAIQFYQSHGFLPTGKRVTDAIAQLNDELTIPEIEMVRNIT